MLWSDYIGSKDFPRVGTHGTAFTNVGPANYHFYFTKVRDGIDVIADDRDVIMKNTIAKDRTTILEAANDAPIIFKGWDLNVKYDCSVSFWIYYYSCMGSRLLYQKNIRKDKFYMVTFYYYMTLMVGVTLFPIPFQNHITYENDAINFIPFRTISKTITTNNSAKQIIIQLAGNIIMFFPLDILLQYINKNKKRVMNSIIAICIAILIEVLQGFIGRVIYNFKYCGISSWTCFLFSYT